MQLCSIIYYSIVPHVFLSAGVVVDFLLSHDTSRQQYMWMKPVAVITFKVCKSVHHRIIQINHQPDATTFRFIILTFV